LVEGAPVGRDELRAQQQVFGRVAGDGEFRDGDDVRPGGAGLFDAADDLRRVAREVADGRVDLRECDADGLIASLTMSCERGAAQRERR
jgi:hypothetical protein